MSEFVFVSIELLKSDADIVDRDVTEHVLCRVCKEEEEKEEVCKEEEKEEEEEEEEEEDCEACEEEEKEHCNAVINEVKRSRITSRSLKECEKVKVNDNVSENVV